jgi:hypothetical protein
MQKEIDMKKFSSFSDWNHVVYLSFYACGWFNDDCWRVLVENAENFMNLENLWLSKHFFILLLRL